MFGVIMGHTAIWGEITPIASGGGPTSLYSILPQGGFLGAFLSAIVEGGEMAVDAFFFMSAFLVMFILLRKLDKGNLGTHFSLRAPRGEGKSALLWIPSMYLHRWLRIIPLMIYVIWLFMWLSQYWGEIYFPSLSSVYCAVQYSAVHLLSPLSLPPSLPPSNFALISLPAPLPSQAPVPCGAP